MSLVVFESHTDTTNAAIDAYHEALVTVNFALCDGVSPSREQAIALKHAILFLVHELAHFDASMPLVIDGWEVGLVAALQVK